MRNPFKTEAAAFRFLMLTIGYFGLTLGERGAARA